MNTEPIYYEQEAMTCSMISHDESETLALATQIGRLCRPGDIIALHGELGGGKTRFVSGLAAGLGIDPREVSSPTFTIMQEYVSDEGPMVLVHMDAYRLGGAEDLAGIGWERGGEAFREGAVVAIEWASRIEAALPEDRLEVTLSHAGDGTRHVTMRGLGGWSGRLREGCGMLSGEHDESHGAADLTTEFGSAEEL